MNPLRQLRIVVWIFIFFTGCMHNDEIALIDEPKMDDPLMTADTIDVLFSDSGKIQAHLTSPLLKKYVGENAYTEFPNGFHLIVFDSALRPSTTITGNYGKNRDAARIMEARGNVIVKNLLKNKQLETECLIWDENKRLIYSEGKVKIIEPAKILYGNGIQANESFTWYKIINPTGQMMVKKDSV